MDFEANKEQRPRQTPSDFHKAQFSISVDDRNAGSVQVPITISVHDALRHDLPRSRDSRASSQETLARHQAS